MTYFRHIDKGEGPVKLIIGGVHGNEYKHTIELIKLLKYEDFGPGQIYIYNLNKTKYLSTLNPNYYKTPQGKKIIKLINKYKPDFYTELHSYNIEHYKNLTENTRLKKQHIPPLIDCGNHVLVSSVSPLIRFKNLDKDAVCKTIEIPTINKKEVMKKYNFNKNLTNNRAMDLLYLITKSNTRKEYTTKISKKYPKQVELAIEYVTKYFKEDFSPF